MKQQIYIQSEATRRRQRRERAANPTPRKGLTIAEWRSLPEPDREAEPARHETWSMYQHYEEPPPMPHEPNIDAVAMHASRGKSLPPSVVRVLNRYTRTTAKINRLDVPTPTRAALRELARSDANAALAPLRQDWATTKASVEDITQRRMQPKALDTAAELRVGRAWDRVERLLDKAPEGERLALVEQHLRRAKESGDEVTLRALYEGVPSYLEASERDDRGRERTSKLRDVIVEVAAPPEAARAHAERKAFEKGASRVDLTFAQAEHALSSEAGLFESSGDSQFPGWAENELYSLTPPTSDERADDDEAGLRALLR